MAQDTVVDPLERQQALAELGLDENDLAEVIRSAEMDASTCTPFDPPGNEGHVRWASGTRYFRLKQCPKGWLSLTDHGGLSVTRHPSGKHQVVVAMGDAGTGDPLASARTKNARGPATAAAIETNAQLDLFAAASIKLQLGRAPSLIETRFLLVHRSGDEIRAELSVPAMIGESGHVTYFRKRILLAAISVTPPPQFKRFDEEEDVEVPVRRRGK